MKYALRLARSIAATILTIGLLAREAKGAITITGLSLTETNIFFNVSGTLPGVPPVNQKYGLVIQSPTQPTTFTTVGVTFASSVSSLKTHSSVFVDSAGSTYPDYLYIDYGTDDLFAGATLNDTFSATWSAPVFDPATEKLEFRWGWLEPNLGGDILLTTVTIPEPSSAFLLSLCAMGYVARRRATLTVASATTRTAFRRL